MEINKKMSIFLHQNFLDAQKVWNQEHLNECAYLDFLKSLTNIGDIIPIEELQKNVKEKEDFGLRCDVDNMLPSSVQMASMEEKLSVPSTYYIQPMRITSLRKIFQIKPYSLYYDTCRIL